MTTSTVRATGAILLLAALGTAPSVTMAVAPESVSLVTTPGVQLGSSEIYGVVNGSAFAPGAPAALATDASISEVLFDGLGVVESKAQGSATMASATSGAVDFKASFQISVLRPEVLPYLPVGYNFNSFWEYRFTTTTDARLTVDYDVDAGVLLGPAFGGWNIALEGAPHVPPSFVNGSGSFVADLVAGQDYSLKLFTPGFTTFDEAVLAAGTETADFRWSIAEDVTAPVPEPATWLLTATSLLALASRRQRSGKAEPAAPRARRGQGVS